MPETLVAAAAFEFVIAQLEAAIERKKWPQQAGFGSRCIMNPMVFTHIPSSVLLVTVAIAPSYWVAAALLLMREGLVEMDVPTRESYVMAIVKPEERTFASGVTGIVRMAGWAIAAGFSGVLLRTFDLWTLLIVGAATKIGYDRTLWYSFSHIKPPEEAHRSRAHRHLA